MLGISEALVATAAGLFVAIPCAVMYNYFMNQVKRFAVEMEVASKELVVFMSERERLSEKKETPGF
jgi:biopolymer transport protein ExbB/TolQ